MPSPSLCAAVFTVRRAERNVPKWTGGSDRSVAMQKGSPRREKEIITGCEEHCIGNAFDG